MYRTVWVKVPVVEHISSYRKPSLLSNPFSWKQEVTRGLAKLDGEFHGDTQNGVVCMRCTSLLPKYILEGGYIQYSQDCVQLWSAQHSTDLKLLEQGQRRPQQ